MKFDRRASNNRTLGYFFLIHHFGVLHIHLVNPTFLINHVASFHPNVFADHPDHACSCTRDCGNAFSSSRRARQNNSDVQTETNSDSSSSVLAIHAQSSTRNAWHRRLSRRTWLLQLPANSPSALALISNACRRSRIFARAASSFIPADILINHPNRLYGSANRKERMPSTPHTDLPRRHAHAQYRPAW
ncbi:hypothetical protein LMG28614_06287 [Paraburkholderia ultramafica]|uniref:Uncharacterized protein n=1 Tax=Paraburkholderia ultramafica TaxID=1544867 RepID=A0A6S7CCE5_9BURK|nr:hypothetical protein LMG28614_06287 [Paraburkholderia ultramafica]